MRSRSTSRLSSGILVLVALSLVAGCGGAKSRLASHLERGKEYYAKGDWRHASVEFRNVLQINPKFEEAIYLNGSALEHLGDVRGAIGSYQAAIELKPDDPAPRGALGHIFLLGGAPERAMQTVSPALKTHPLDPLLLVVRAGARVQAHDDAGAAADAELAVKQAPANEEALAILASVYRRTDGPPKAIALLEGALVRVPNSVDLRLILGSLYEDAGDEAKAEATLVRLVALRPDDLDQRTRLALYYVNHKRPDDAEAVLRAAVQALPARDQAKLELANLISRQRSHDVGEQTLRDFVAKQPKDLDLRFGLAELLVENGQQEEAKKVYREIMQLTAADSSSESRELVAEDRLAQLEAAAGHDDLVRPLVVHVLKKNPRDNDALVLRSNLELAAHDPAAAIEDLRSVLRDQPDSLPLQRALARAQFANGDSPLAEATLRAAVKAAPKDFDAHTDLAQLLLDARRVDDAIALLEETVQQHPDNPRGRELLARAYLVKENWTAARTAANDLETLRPNSPTGYYLAGVADLGHNRFEDSQKELEHALKLQPTALDTLSALIRLEVSQGRSSDAIALLRRRLEADPKNAFVANLLGEVNTAIKNLPDAEKNFQQAIEIDPKWSQPRRNLAIARIAAKDVDGAIAAYEGAVAVAPNDPQLVGELASLYESRGRADDAIARYETLYQGEARNRQFAANNLAMLLVTYRRDPASLDRARALTEDFAKSQDPGLLDTNGWVRLKQGAVQDALPVLEHALERAPNSNVIRYHVAVAELRAGQRDKARADLEAALAHSTQFDGAEDAKAVLATLKRSSG